MTVKSGQAWYGLFVCKDATGALSTPSVGPAGALYVDGTVNAASVTISGSNPYKFAVTLPALTAGQCVSMYITATIATIATASVVAENVADTVRLSDVPAVNVTMWAGEAAGDAPLKPTTAGRTLDVSATGEAGIDWANVGSPTTTVGLSGTTIKSSTDTETDIAALPTAVEIVAAIDADPPGVNVVQQAGSAVTPTAIPGVIYASATEVLSAVWVNAVSVRTAVGMADANLDTQLGDLPTNAELATALAAADDAVLAAVADVPTVAEFEARTLAAAEYVVVSDLPSVPSAADIKTALEADGSKLDHLWEMTEDDGGVRRLTANALEEAPAGGSGTADWTSDEREQIRYRLQLDGTQTAPADTDLPAVNVTMQQGVAVAAADADGNVPVVLYPKQGAVTFNGQVEILANVPNQGALHVVNSHANGHGQYSEGGYAGQYNNGNHAGQTNTGNYAGQTNYGGAASVVGAASQEIADALKRAPAAGTPAVGSVYAKLNALTATGIYSYSDTVTDPNSIPLDGARVLLATDQAFTHIVSFAYSNAQGAFTVRSDTPGTHYLRIQLAGYQFSDQSVELA